MKILRQVVAGAFVSLFVGLAMPALGQGRIGAAVGTAVRPELRVDGFDVEQVSDLSPGTALNFSLYGTAGGHAALRIDGARQRLPLREVQAGVYEGSYLIAAGDHITGDSRVTADLWMAEHAITAVLDEPLLLGGTLAAAPARGCEDCAVVEAVRPVEVMGRPGAFGAIAGGVLGAILGHQVGRGDGRTLAGVLGAVGGAYAGRELERRQQPRLRYDVVVRLPDGSAQTRRYESPPPFRVGDRLRVGGGAWLPDAAAH
ncbi:glycine zipper 2TM domain-containing protein [Piscinibacter sp. XHJ-5]|uniref:glycine zipper 2TM domain-containing protein n=1 Tax=Piscinibacter sp. XHJ-5 TaxID=3037797 RepID=UPI002452F372|nr:glycine zipper 2TM domain-containing protein [Piscinibacter sp. XHJ-5]